MRRRAKDRPWEKARRTGEAIRLYREHIFEALTSQEVALKEAEARAHAEYDPEEDQLREADPAWLAHMHDEGRKLGAALRRGEIIDLVARLKSRPAPSPQKRTAAIAKLVEAIGSDQRLSLLAWNEAFGKQRGNKTKKPRKSSPKVTAANPWAAYDASELTMEIADECVLPIYDRIRQHKVQQAIPQRYDWLPAETDIEIAVDYWFQRSSSSLGSPQAATDNQIRAELINATVKTIRTRGSCKPKAK